MTEPKPYTLGQVDALLRDRRDGIERAGVRVNFDALRATVSALDAERALTARLVEALGSLAHEVSKLHPHEHGRAKQAEWCVACRVVRNADAAIDAFSAYHTEHPEER